MLHVFLVFISFLLNGCQQRNNKEIYDELDVAKNDFIISVIEKEVEESPFHFIYSFRTVFFSKDIVSFFGILSVYDQLPHPRWRYEGKNFCRINDKLQEIRLNDLFPTESQREFLRNYCENQIKENDCSYFLGEGAFRDKLEKDEIRTFVIDDRFFIIFFQPYTVGGLIDDQIPWHVKIPYELLEDKWNTSHPLPQLLKKTLASKNYTESWDGFP